MKLRDALLERVERMCEPEPNSGCRLWLGATTGGYPEVNIKCEDGVHRVVRIHRAIVNPPPGLHALHRCDVKRCLNEQHLYAGTPKQNMQDAIRNGRHLGSPPTMACPQGHLRSEHGVLVGRSRVLQCRLCARERNRRNMRRYRSLDKSRWRVS